jgi:hypothetical protein
MLRDIGSHARLAHVERGDVVHANRPWSPHGRECDQISGCNCTFGVSRNDAAGPQSSVLVGYPIARPSALDSLRQTAVWVIAKQPAEWIFRDGH